MPKIRVAGFLVLIIAIASYLLRPKVKLSDIEQQNTGLYPDTPIPIEPGDLLFSPTGKSESKYVGHVGIVDADGNVIHSIPAGLKKDTVLEYFRKFRAIKIYKPHNPETGEKAARHLALLYEHHPKAAYRILTPLNDMEEQQYCTKIVWQSYYHGAGVSLGRIKPAWKAIHPSLLKDRRHLKRM
ncbi:hypothetical protein [Thalassobacillus hwangdonensis]|uniref:Permuted papain-like amidase enzyme, YaeF/YiiX, C92 family n=1 Tax=Thalassobacillus hwangdonensis TaxID=546108 RepID=A0ABW3L3R7_9BACI